MTVDVHVISHTHWDREWYLTFEQYRARLVDLVDRVLDWMSVDPGFTWFHLDGQSIVVEDYLEIRPEREQEIRTRVAEGRLLIGPWYVMPDMFLVSGEALVRNLAEGLRVAAGFGQAMRVGYMPDPFGHVAQMPQILAGFGLQGAILWRGFAGPRAEYFWDSPDGSRALLLHLPQDGYCNGVRLPLLSASEMKREAASIVAHERARSTSGQVLLMVGVDHVEPHPRLLDVIAAINDMPGVVTARLSTLTTFVSAVSAAIPSGLETIAGELRGGQGYAHLLPGVLSSRTYLKQANARVQRELVEWAEPAAVFALLCGARIPPGELRHAWRTLLQNHPHDSICGCSIDEVHAENVARFGRALQVATLATERALAAIRGRVPAAPHGTIRCLVVNTGPLAWSGVVDAVVDIPIAPAEGSRDPDLSSAEERVIFFADGAAPASVVDHSGRGIAFQVLGPRRKGRESSVEGRASAVEDRGPRAEGRGSAEVQYRMSRYTPPVAIAVQRTHMAVDVADVPALGYAVLDVHVSARGAAAPTPVGDGRVIENDLLRVDARTDGTVDVFDKRTNIRYERVFTLEDVGDVGDEYNYCPPSNDARVLSIDSVRVGAREAWMLDEGPLTAALAMKFAFPVPVAAAPDRRSRSAERVDLDIELEIRVRKGSPAVDCTVRLNNHARDHRLRVLCPTGGTSARNHRADTAFHVVERSSAADVPDGPLLESPVASAPMQSFVDAGDDTVGATVIADGLIEYEVMSTREGSSIAVTLLRCVGDLSRNDLSTRKGHAGPGLPTPGAQCAGPHEFRLAFVPRATPPTAAALYAAAHALLSPPRVLAASSGDGRLPVTGSLLHIQVQPEDGAILSACKVADDRPSVILRFFNPTPRQTSVSLPLPTGVDAAFLTDLAERRTASCPLREGHAHVTLEPYRIQSVELTVRDGED